MDEPIIEKKDYSLRWNSEEPFLAVEIAVGSDLGLLTLVNVNTHSVCLDHLEEEDL